MDVALFAILTAPVVGVLVAVATWLISFRKRRNLAREAEQWIAVEGTIESGALEAARDVEIVLPTFAFSYKAADQYYSGRFSLRASHPNPLAEPALEKKTIGRKILIRYNPTQPELWFIPDKFIEGHEIEQKLGSHAIFDFSPRD
jgi:hypothetical protein